MSKAVEKLIQALQDDIKGHGEMGSILENKLDAMRHFDLSRLEALTGREHRLAEAMSGNAQRRNMAVRRASMEVFPRRRGRSATARELASQLQGSQRDRLLAVSGMLLELTEKVQRLNRINKNATHKVMGHFDYIFRIIAQSGRDIGLYEREGKKAMPEQNRLVDAIA